ncbi:hypothetical protein CASFOL_041369 [Castilleja foliolosa]|uniref:Uncharacterized protein n=1 Tax=Castilleja foliolosa TaxID=1961234 RepID=A0ABD3BES2_9LAMI
MENVQVQGSGLISMSSNNNRTVSEDIDLVKNLIERCLQLYMNRDEVEKTLLSRAKIDPYFTTLVWLKLEKENADFFRAYYIRLELKKQIVIFNNLLEHQYRLMKYLVPPKAPLAAMQNGVHPMPVNNLPMGYTVAPQPPIPATGQPNINAMGYSQAVDDFLAPGNFLPALMNGGNDMLIETGTDSVLPVMPPNSGHFPFSSSGTPDIGVDMSALETGFTSDVASSVGPELTHDNGAGNSSDLLRSLDQTNWNFSLSDLTADSSNLGDLGALENYPGSPFLLSSSDINHILLNSQEQGDLVDEFLVDSYSIPGQCPPLDEVMKIDRF